MAFNSLLGAGGRAAQRHYFPVSGMGGLLKGKLIITAQD